MVANIDKMMYVGEKPWHEQGIKLDKIATSKEAMEAAGLGWGVEKRDIFISSKKQVGLYQKVEGKFSTVREDKEIPLGIVGKVYQPLQNKDAFSFFDGIVGVKEAMYHTAGSLGKGEKVWILAKLPGYIKVVKDDIIEKYLLLTNSHDGTSAVEMLFTPIRVVCQNTLNLAISTSEKKINMRHMVLVMSKIDEVRKQLGIIKYQYDMFEELSKKMTTIQMNKKNFDEFLEKIGLITKDEENKLSTRAEHVIQEVTQLYEHGRGNDLIGVRGTLWGAVNSVIEYVDYGRTSNPEKRAKTILYGSGALLKQKAWDYATEISK